MWLKIVTPRIFTMAAEKKILTVLVVTFSIFHLPAADLSEFRYFKTAENASDIRTQNYTVIRLDSDIFAATPDLNTGMFVTDQKHSPHPFIIEKLTWAGISKHLEKCPSKIISLDKKDPTQQIIEVENIDLAYVSNIEIATHSENFSKALEVFASEDRRNWKPIKSHNIILNYSSFDLKETTIEINSNNSRYFKLLVHDINKEHLCPARMILASKPEMLQAVHQNPIKIDGINLYHALSFSKTLDYCTSVLDIKQTSHSCNDEHCTNTFQTRNQPIQGFEIRFDFEETFNEIVISGSNDGIHWQPILQTPYMNIDIPGCKLIRNTFNFPESRFQYYRIQYDRTRNSETQGLMVKAISPVYQILLEGKQPEQLLVYYGGKTNRVELKKSKISNADRKLQVEYQLQPQLFNPDFGTVKHYSDIKIFFPFVIIAIMVILGLIVKWKVKRSINQDNRQQE